MAEIIKLEVKQGESFERMSVLVGEDKVTPLNTENYTFRGQIRENFTSDAPPIDFTITKMLPYTTGTVVISLTPEQTRSLTQRKYVFDIEFTDDSVIPQTKPLMEGYVVVRQSTLR